MNERKKLYGNFKNLAEISQKIKDIYYTENNELDPTINETFEMIVHKLSRIINGGSRYIDNWRDVAGYAQLAIDYLEKDADNAIDSKVTYFRKSHGQKFTEFNLEEEL